MENGGTSLVRRNEQPSDKGTKLCRRELRNGAALQCGHWTVKGATAVLSCRVCAPVWFSLIVPDQYCKI